MNDWSAPSDGWLSSNKKASTFRAIKPMTTIAGEPPSTRSSPIGNIVSASRLEWSNGCASSRWMSQWRRAIGTALAPRAPYGERRFMDADRRASDSSAGDCVRQLDGHARGDLPGNPRVLRRPQPVVQDDLCSEVLLRCHV